MIDSQSLVAEQYRRIARRMRFSTATSWIGFVLQAAIARKAVALGDLLSWVGLVVAAELGVRLLAGRLGQAAAGDPQRARRRLAALDAGVLLSGGLWGLSALLPGLLSSPSVFIVNTAALVVIGTFAVHNLSLNARSLACFSGALLTPTLFLCLTVPIGDDRVDVIVALACVAALVMIQLYGAGSRKIERQEIVQGFCVANLVQALTAKNEELAKALDRLTELAAHDPLTGCLNRRAFAERASDRSARSPSTTGVLVVDVDFFKRINDTHGHEVGDGVLVELSRRIRAVLRESDAVARWGGEEFVCLVEAIDETQLGELAERLRLRICCAPFIVGAQRLRVSVSVGAAVFAGGEGFKSVVDRADQALYRSKREGRNRVTMDGIAAMP